MVEFSRSVSYLFGRLVNYSAFQFSIYLAVWIRPSVPVRLITLVYFFSLIFGPLVFLFFRLFSFYLFGRPFSALWTPFTPTIDCNKVPNHCPTLFNIHLAMRIIIYGLLCDTDILHIFKIRRSRLSLTFVR